MGQRNIFEAGAVEITQLFEDYLEGEVQPGSCIALALSERALGPSSRAAIGKSLSALGICEEAFTCATVLPGNAETEGGDVPLDAQSLFLLVEGLDPLRIIAADRVSANLLASAYRISFPPNAAVRVFGRPAVVFNDLEKMLQTDAGKQNAWSLFKTLS